MINDVLDSHSISQSKSLDHNNILDILLFSKVVDALTGQTANHR